MKTAAVIPNWNGEELLRKNLPSVFKAGFDEVVVVDDCSTDKSVEEIKNSKLKMQNSNLKLKILENEENLGFARTVNRGVEATRADIVFLLNTDVTPAGDIIKPVLEHFRDPEVFGVSLNEGKYGWARPKIESGFLGHEPGERTNRKHATFWVSGGSGAFRKSMWDKLGGLDTIYSPFYWEDVDLSFRALKQGWKLVWEPEARVEHEHEATINKRYFSERYLNYIKERNQLIFLWKNIEAVWLFKYHLVGVLRRLVSAPGYFVPLLLALVKLPYILQRRLGQKNSNLVLKDVLSSFN